MSRSVVEHFDEGVYASNLYFGPPDYTYPLQRFYAPPLLPALIEAGMIARLPPNLAALLPSFLAGCGTIAALWWMGRSWFGPRVGLLAAGLAASSPFQIGLSTTALTDTLLGLFLLLALTAIARSIMSSDYRWAIGGGLLTGLAWWTKYNGWLPLVIEATAIGGLWIVDRWLHRKQVTTQVVACFLITTLTAMLVWSPFYLSIGRSGYAEIASNHANYVVGFAGWLQSAARQIANATVVTGPAQTWLSGGLHGFGFLAVIGMGARGIREIRARGATTQPLAITGICMLAAWWLGLLVATPCYWPYSRLLLPWLLACYLGVAIFLDEVMLRWNAASVPQNRLERWQLPVVGGIALCSAAVLTWNTWPTRESLLTHARQRRGLIDVAAALQEGMERAIAETGQRKEPADRVVYILGEPALLFQLASRGEQNAIPVQEFPAASASRESEPLPTFLVTGPHFEQDITSEKRLALTGKHWEFVSEHEYSPSWLVWLDLHDPRQAAGGPASQHRFKLYRFAGK